MEEMKRMQVDVTCLYEINLDTTNHGVKSKMHKNSRQIFDHSRLTMSSSTIPSANDFKPGGTLMLAQGHVTGRITSSGEDDMGRWTYQRFACKNHRYLTVISAYQVCEQPIVDKGKVRTLTGSAQQTSILKQQGREISPRKAFCHDLDKFLKSCKKDKSGILLVGDFNEALGCTASGITQVLADNDLTDIMLHEIGEDNFETYIEGKQRIDFCAGTDWVSLSVINACYEPFCFRTKGDHRNMIIDFDTVSLFGNPTYNLEGHAQRQFTSKSKGAVKIYLEQKYAYLEEHNFNQRLQELKRNWNAKVA